MNNQAEYERPLISVVIPVRNEEKFIGQTLQYLIQQDYPREKVEIIVVDGRSDDSTRQVIEDIAARDARIRLLDNPKRISSAARNIGVKAATGDIITFIDGHVYIDRDQLLRNTAILMNERKVSVLSRPQFLDTPDNGFFQKAVALARKSAFGHGLDSTIYLEEEKLVDPTSSGASYKREVFERAGYFDESFDAAEDVEFNFRVSRAGFKSFTSPKLAVYYYPRNSLRGLFKQMTRYGVGRFRFLRKHHQGVSSGALLLALFYIGLILLVLLSILSNRLLPVAGIFLALYVAANLVSSLIAALKRGIKYLPVLPLIYLTIHFGLAWGFINEALSQIRGPRRKILR